MRQPSPSIVALVVALAVALVAASPALATEPTTPPEPHHDHHVVHHHAPPRHPERHERRRETHHHPRPPVTPPAATAAPKPVAPVPPAPPPKPPVGSSTGLPIPRYASLRADEVNLRAGPGTQYPIQWVFKHQGMPVEIRREFDVWRLVGAPDGTVGWVHQATLVGSRTFFVPDGTATLPLRQTADAAAPVVAELRPGVIGRLVRCDAGAGWCRVAVHELVGFVPRDAIWGLLPGEAVGGPAS